MWVPARGPVRVRWFRTWGSLSGCVGWDVVGDGGGLVWLFQRAHGAVADCDDSLEFRDACAQAVDLGGLLDEAVGGGHCCG